jgi:two-component sensor histidine kinase
LTPAHPAGAPRRRLTIRFRLALAVALALTPVLALGAYQSLTEFQRDAREQSTMLSMAAVRSASGVRARLVSAAALLDTLSPQTIGVECASRLATLVDRVQGYENVVRFDAGGRVMCSAASVRADPGRRDAPWFRQLAEGAQFSAAAAPPGVFGPSPGVLTAVRTQTPDGRFDGAMVSVVKLDTLRPEGAGAALPRDTEVVLLDEDGRAMTRTGVAGYAPLPQNWRELAMEPDGLIYSGKDETGRARMQSVSSLIGRNVFVLVSTPKPGLLFWAQINPFQGVILPLLAFVLTWIAVAWAADRVVIRWLSYLDRIAALYAKGRLSVRPVQADNAPEEIRALAQTLDQMAEAIAQRDQVLHEQMAHKDAMMREIHHRVKNNLQVITSLLNMQQRALKDPAAQAAMSDTRQRINALALIYRALYQSPDLRRIDVRQFLEELTAQLTAGEGGRPSPVRTVLEADDLEIDPDKLPPLALFAVEAISNARKHAFGEDGGLIQVRFQVAPEEVTLEIADDGQGDDGALSGAEPGPGVGRTLMAAFARQLRGRAEFRRNPEGGVSVLLSFPTPETVSPEAPLGGAGNGQEASARAAE